MATVLPSAAGIDPGGPLSKASPAGADDTRGCSNVLGSPWGGFIEGSDDPSYSGLCQAFADGTTAHGLPRAFEDSARLRRGMWVVLFAFGLSMWINLSWSAAGNYFSHASVTSGSPGVALSRSPCSADQ